MTGVAGILSIRLAVRCGSSNFQSICARIAPAGVKAISKMLPRFVICIGVETLREGLKVFGS